MYDVVQGVFGKAPLEQLPPAKLLRIVSHPGLLAQTLEAHDMRLYL